MLALPTMKPAVTEIAEHAVFVLVGETGDRNMRRDAARGRAAGCDEAAEDIGAVAPLAKIAPRFGQPLKQSVFGGCDAQLGHQVGDPAGILHYLNGLDAGEI